MILQHAFFFNILSQFLAIISCDYISICNTLDTDFHTVYEEAKLLTDYYEEQRTKEFIQERTERIIGTMEFAIISCDYISICNTKTIL